MFDKIETKKVYENVLEQIIKRIVDGKLVPGDSLPPERELAEQLGVSRPSLREALRILQVLGVIKNSPKTGTIIQQVNPEQIFQTLSMVMVTSPSETSQLLEIRKSIETEMCYYAALRRDEKDLKSIGNTLENLSKAADSLEFKKYDYEFHYTIACAAKNIFFKYVLEMISNLIDKQMFELTNKIMDIGLHQRMVEQHKMIFEEISNKNAEEARLAMKNHIEFAEGISTLVDREK
ncbi:FadR/GntR family transcriptional regulator [Oceanobacillus neutriphilus]|uniref:FadR/GntR family transcriptional regulator n=1 Tax=Oceanobacillus neutriphilus TaxID=531815 RepID=UPI00166D811A|nr:FadR/GntR family transcriptional regulator [Oceanobacillus neutriphilus]